MANTRFELASFTTLKALLGLFWLAVIGDFVTAKWVNPALPPQILSIIESYPTHQLSIIISIVGVLTLLLATPLLLLRKDLGRWLWLFGVILILISAYFYGPQVSYLWTQLFEGPASLVLGLIIAAIWCEPLNALFSKASFNLATINSVKIFVVIMVLSLLFSFLCPFIFAEKLTPLLQNFSNADSPSRISMLMALLWFIGSFVAGCCLLFRVNWARYCFVISSIINVIFVTKYQVELPGWPFVNDVFGAIISGVLTVLLFIPSIVNQFQSSVKEEPTRLKTSDFQNGIGIVQPVAQAIGPAQYYVTPIWKLCLMSIIFGGWYSLYWWYKNWRYIQQRDKSNIEPFWRGFFAPFTYFYRFLLDLKSTVANKSNVKFPYEIILCVFIVVYIASIAFFIYGHQLIFRHLSLTLDYFHYLFAMKLFAILPLLLTQLTINQLNKNAVIEKTKTPTWQIILFMIAVVFFAFVWFIQVPRYVITTYFPVNNAAVYNNEKH